MLMCIELILNKNRSTWKISGSQSVKSGLPAYREINPLVASNPLSWIVGIRSYGILFVVVCDRSRIQPPASQSTTSHKDITYDLINILVKEFSPCGSVTKICGNVTEATQ